MTYAQLTKTVRLAADKTDRAWVHLPSYILEVLRGPDLDAQHQFGGTIVVGREAACDFRLTDPSVSGRHVKLDGRGDGVWLTDLDSTNGTFVDDTRVGKARLTSGSRLRLGDVECRLVKTDDPVLVVARDEAGLGDLVGTAEPLRLLYGVIRRVAPTDLTVLLHGESGTGKEVVARTLHALSTRSAAPFVVVDATTRAGPLANGELFGHEKGSFTGADARRVGAFERADGGTVFLDEIGELSPTVQSRLLRVLEASTFSRVGGNAELKTDVRVIAATHRDLAAMVRDGDFREDLLYRINEVGLELPPLRERLEDLPLLVATLQRRLLPRLGPGARAAEFTPAALAALGDHDWPGNVRELRNYLARLLALVERRPIDTVDLLPFDGSVLPDAEATTAPMAARDGDEGARGTLAEVERQMLVAAMARAKNVKAKAARELDIPVSTLRDRLKKYGLE